MYQYLLLLTSAIMLCTLKSPDCVLYYKQVHDVITLLQFIFKFL